MGNHVFICYAREDEEFVLKLAASLRDRGVPVWLDQWDIPHGANWNKTRDDALYEAARCLIVLSPAAVDSEQVQAEWVTALEEQKPIVPILYRSCRIPSRLRLIHRFDFTTSSLQGESAFDLLVHVLGGEQLKARAEGVASVSQLVDKKTTEEKQEPQHVMKRPEEAKPTVIVPPTVQLEIIRNSIGMELVLIPAGEFRMGAEDGDDDEKPVHLVRITCPVHIGKYPVTQAQWEAVMGKNPSSLTGDPNRPVETVSWPDVQEFLRRLSEKDGGKPYRLPTEAEGEYAARAGAETAYCFGNESSQLREYAWYDGNSGRTTHPVGQLKPNAWGLYDVHGNVWEWVQDWYAAAYYQRSPVEDPTGPKQGQYKVVRGGSWGGPRLVRVSYRHGGGPGGCGGRIGFRCVQ